MRRHKDLHRPQETKEPQLADLFHRTIDHFPLDRFHDQRLVVEGELGLARALDDFGSGLEGGHVLDVCYGDDIAMGGRGMSESQVRERGTIGAYPSCPEVTPSTSAYNFWRTMSLMLGPKYEGWSYSEQQGNEMVERN